MPEHLNDFLASLPPATRATAEARLRHLLPEVETVLSDPALRLSLETEMDPQEKVRTVERLAWQAKHPQRPLRRNAIRCRHCGDIIESRYGHDFKFCSCGRVAVDGGLAYARWLGDISDFHELAEYEDE
jgi:hypothetical protein